MTQDLSLSLRGFLFRSFSRKIQCVFATGLGLLFFQGCALLQGPTDIAAPSDAPVPPATPKTSAGVRPAPAQPMAKQPAVTAKLPQTGEASWYGPQHQGKQTASGTTFDQNGLTAAHQTLPFGSKVKVTNLANGKSIEVEINDRGPFVENRIIDLSQAAAKALDIVESGTATVRLELASGP